MRRHAPFELTEPNTCMWGGVPDVINRAIFWKIDPRVSVLSRLRYMAFPIDSLVVLESVISWYLHNAR